MNSVYKIVAVLIIGIVSCKGKIKDQTVTLQQPESETYKMKLTHLNNRPIDLGQYREKTLFINFWATWCKPCLKEMPSVQKAKDILKNENIIFLLASSETAEQIEKFKNEHDYNFDYVRVANVEELNIMALPTTFIFNPDGELVFSEMGFRKWDDKKNIDLLLNIAESK